MKKVFLYVICIAMVALSLFGLTACYTSKPDTMGNLTGTYQLTYFTSKPKDAGQDVEPTDMIKEKGVVAYLVIKDDGTGYYTYKDNDTEAWVRSVRINYSYDEEDSSKVKEIRYTDGMGAKDTERYPGTGKEVLGLTFNKKEKKLHYNQPAVLSVKQSTVVTYEKVSDSFDLSYIAGKMSLVASVAQFEVSGLTNLSLGDYGETCPYIYYILSFNASGKVDEYYQLKSGGEPVVHNGLNVEVVATSAENNTISIKIGEKTYTRVYSYSEGLGRGLNITYPATEAEPERYEFLYNDGRPVSEIIAEQTEWYRQSQAQQNGEE